MRTLLSTCFLLLAACSSSSSGSSGLVVDDVQPTNVTAVKAADGHYDATVQVTAHGAKVVSARIDFPSEDPATIVGAETPVTAATLSKTSIAIPIAAKAGPGTGDANVVLTDDGGNVAKKKITVTMP